MYEWFSQVVSFLQVSPQTPCICHSSLRYVLQAQHITFFTECYRTNNSTHLKLDSATVTCTQHIASLSQSEHNPQRALLTNKRKSKPQSAITALSLFSGYVSTINCVSNVGCSCHIFQFNCNINLLTPEIYI